MDSLQKTIIYKVTTFSKLGLKLKLGIQIRDFDCEH